MDVRVANHQVDTGESLREHAERRIAEITEKYFSRSIGANVTFGRGPSNDFTCDIVAPVRQGVVLKASHNAREAEMAFNGAADRIEKQLRRYMRRLKDHKADDGAQAYVENAILHGLSQSEADSLKLSITTTLQNEYIIYTIEDNGIGREQSAKYKQHNKPFHKSLGSQLTQERIDIFNRQHNAESRVVITDLYNANNEPCGTRVQVKIKAL